jgi:hypothetical protein
MKLFLQLELRNWQESGYEKPLLTFASSLSSDLIGAEMDNQSDASIADLVIRLSDQVQSIFILIQAQPNEPFGSGLKLLNHLLRTKEKIHSVVISGSHEQAQKLMATIGERFKKEDDPEKIKIWIKEFALA